MLASLMFLALFCAAFSPALPSSQFTRAGSDRGHETFGPGSFSGKLENRYHLNITCEPRLQNLGHLDFDSIGYSRYPMTNKELSWFLKPTGSQPFHKPNVTIVPVRILESCDKAEYIYPGSKVDGDSLVLFLHNSPSCTPLQLITTGRRVFKANIFMIFHTSYDFSSSAMSQMPSETHDIFVFVYDEKRITEQLAQIVRNRTCTMNAYYMNGGMDGLINKTSVLFVSISFIFLMLISVAWLVFYYIQRFRYIHAKERLSRRLLGAAKKALTNIPVKVLKTCEKDLPWQLDQCSVCIEPFKMSESVRVLPCRHYFHKSCIDPWLLDQRTCPLCKLCILKAYGLQVRGHRSGSQNSLDREHAQMSVSPEPRRRSHVVLVCSATETSPTEPSDEAQSVDGPIQMTLEPPEVQYHQRHEVRLERAPSEASLEDEAAQPLVTAPV